MFGYTYFQKKANMMATSRVIKGLNKVSPFSLARLRAPNPTVHIPNMIKPTTSVKFNKKLYKPSKGLLGL